MKNKEYIRHFNNALSNYQGVLDLHGSDIEKKLIEADIGLIYPEKPSDIIEYLGNIEPLNLDESQKNEVREFLKKEIDRYGSREVWQYKLRDKLEIYYISTL